jgi:1,4-alpha-glucan branching enzyme
MKFLFSLLLIIMPGHYIFGQVLITVPVMPLEDAAVTITFNATAGDAGLSGFTGDVYAHTGVITSKSTSSSDWKYVKASWSTNLSSCKLTRTATNTYQLTISPSIREFYGVPSGETILKMAFVFRNSTGTKTGRDTNGADIFATVYQTGLNVTFSSPSGLFKICSENEIVPISATATGNDSLTLFLDGTRLKSTTAQTIVDSVTAVGTSKHILIATAYYSTYSTSDTTSYFIPQTTTTEQLPNGVIDGINYTGQNSATLVLFAPYKSRVFVLGDFNNWVPDNDYLMKKDADRFWLTLNNLTAQKEYIFQYLIDDTLLIADPYCEKTSDPLDVYIDTSTYPDLLTYPSDKTSEIASVLETGQTNYNWKVTNYTPTAKGNLVIYELLIRDFTANKNIKTITDTLRYFKKLGITAIELMPFNEFEGNDSWGYNPSFYFAPDKAYGTKNDYKTFIDSCHSNGIAVIIDMVLNHSYGSCPFVRMYWDGDAPAANNPWYNQKSNMQNTSLQYGYDFNHESLYTQKLVDSINSFWMSEYKIDGFRFDFTKGFSNTSYSSSSWGSEYDTSRIQILERMATQIWKRKSDAYIIFEHLADNTEETVLSNFGIMLWGNMNYNYNEGTMGYYQNSDLSWASYINRGWTNPNLVLYMESHDEERLMYKNIAYGNSSGSYNITDTITALSRMELAANFFLAIPGPKMIWQFGELGYDISKDYNGTLSDKPVHWEYYSDENRLRVFNVFSFINKLKTTEPLFYSTANYTLSGTGDVKTLTLSADTSYAFIVGNFNVISQTKTLSFPRKGIWYDYYTGDSLSLDTTARSLILSPGEYHLYATKKLSGYPANPLSVKNTQTENFVVYPNPAQSTITIKSEYNPQYVKIYSLTGQLLYSRQFEESMDVSFLSKGIYLLKLEFRHSAKTIKLIKD